MLMASDSEMSDIDQSLVKIRKDYLKLSKAKLSKECKALKIDAYGTKAVLVDHLMKEHEKKLSLKHNKHTAPKQPRRKTVHPAKYIRPIKLNISSKSNTLSYQRKRSKSINIVDKPNKYNKYKSRRSSVALTPKPMKSRKDLLKMSKNEIMKQCRLQHVNVNGLRNKNDMVNKLVNIEELFQEKKQRELKKKKRKNGLRRTKSEDVSLVSPRPKDKGKKSIDFKVIHSPLPPLTDEPKIEENDMKYLIDFDCDLRHCISRKRLIGALKYYEDNYNEQGNNENMLRDFINKYSYILSDWHHILLGHLDCKIIENYKNFNILYDDIKKQHLLCDINQCSYYIQNNRNREDISIDEHNNVIDIDLNSRFIMDLIGNIHVYLVHSFDIGFRLRNYNSFTNSFSSKKKDELYKYLYFDDEMASFQQYYATKRKQLEKMRGIERVKLNKYFTYVDHDSNNNDKKIDDIDIEIKKEENDNNNMNLSSLKECNTKQIIRILKDYFFDDINSGILNHYRKKIIGYFEENDWNGIELSQMTEIAFVTELEMRCDNNKNLKGDLVKLFNLFDFTDFSETTETIETIETNDDYIINNIIESEEIKHITGCDHKEIIYILKHYLFDKLNDKLLNENRDKIIEYFMENNIDGIILFDMKRKKFCENMIKYCNNNRKLNHSFIILYKEFFKIDLSQIDYTSTYKSNSSLDELMNIKLVSNKIINKKKKRRGIVESQFTTGYRFLYWQYYQNNKWFVHKKYSNLKEEILDNIVHSLNGSKWDETYNKALMIKQSEIIKIMKCDSDKWSEIYGITKDISLKMSHLLSIILYTDYIDLAFEFVKSFKKISVNESNEELKNRHGEYANWARCLRETVECFGCKVKDSKIDIFYYGMSEQVVFKSFIGRFYLPTSTTIHLSIAKLFVPENNGIILELEKYKGGLELTYFNCSLFSNFSFEDERLFIGGYRPLQFHGIHVINKNENYMWFISALIIFNDFLNGKKISFKGKKHQPKSIHYMIINQLCKHKASINRNDNKLNNNYFRNTFPKYINNIFDSYCNKKKQININLKWLNQCYVGFKSYFTQSVINDETKPISSFKRVTFNGNMKPETISIKPSKVRIRKDSNDIYNNGDIKLSYRERRRHSISGSMIQTDVINGKYLFQIFKYIHPIHVQTEIEGLLYDIVPTLPNLIFVYKLNDKLQPISIDNRIKKDFKSSMQFKKNINIVFIENSLYKYYLNKDFYVKHILQILNYFFDSKTFDNKQNEPNKNNMLINNGITEILKWKYNIFKNKIRFSQEIYKYFTDKKEIDININRIKMCSEASHCLLHEKCKRLCFFNIISSLFIKCEKIICYDIKVISAYYLQELLIILQNANKNKYYKLKHIILYQPLKIQVSQQEYAKFKQRFVRNNWKMTKKYYNDNENNLYLCFDKIVLRR